LSFPPYPTLNLTLTLPVRTRSVEEVPKIISGGVPVTPLNIALQRRQLEEGSTIKSLKTYARAARLYVEFCAHRSKSLIDISNEEFVWFKRALLGETFLNAEGQRTCLNGKRGPRTADLMLTLLYALASDVEERYEVSFDWRRYKSVPSGSSSSTLERFSGSRSGNYRRSHHIRWIPRKILGLPNDQFVALLRAAHTRWGKEIGDGDVAYAEKPEEQRGALFYRNVALLLVLRFAGSRRSEVTRLRFEDIDRSQSVNMRHASSRSGEPYAAGPQIFADELLEPSNEKLAQLFTQADLLEQLEQSLTQATLPEDSHEH